MPITLMAHSIPCPTVEIKKHWQRDVVFLCSEMNTHTNVKVLDALADASRFQQVYRELKAMQMRGMIFQVVFLVSSLTIV